MYNIHSCFRVLSATPRPNPIVFYAYCTFILQYLCSWRKHRGENNGYVVFKSLSTDQLAKGWGLGGVTPSAPIPFLALFKEDCNRESLLQHPNGMLCSYSLLLLDKHIGTAREEWVIFYNWHCFLWIFMHDFGFWVVFFNRKWAFIFNTSPFTLAQRRVQGNHRVPIPLSTSSTRSDGR
jgi:hypothetical protein